MSDGHDYEVITICITKRAAAQLRYVGARIGRTAENLAECAVEEACLESEHEHGNAHLTLNERRQ